MVRDCFVVVDAVVTWVDGCDEAHLTKRLKYLDSLQKVPSDEAAVSTRFNSSGEIEYCLRSLLSFAPWLRTIYIVTDGQTPPILKAWQGTLGAQRIQVVDHRDIFHGFEQYLPTFNSLTIETMLWRIPGLSEHFIYLNDDCMLLRPLKEEDFFREGRPVVRGSWKTHSKKKQSYRFNQSLVRRLPRFFSPKVRSSHRRVQEKSASMAGFNQKFMHLPHVPFPLKKQIFADFFEANEDILRHNLKYPLRDPNQFWCISWAYHMGMQHKQVVLDNTHYGMTVHATHHAPFKIYRKLAQARRDSHAIFVCIQSLDQGTPEVRDVILRWLERCIPPYS
jgi:hypothetical protein